LYDSFLEALQGKLPGSSSNTNNEEVSLAASYASSAPPFSPGSGASGGDDSGNYFDTNSPSPSSSRSNNKRFMSPFSRLRVGRWKASSPVGTLSLEDNDHDDNTASATTAHHHALAKDMEDDPDDANNNNDSNSQHSDNISTALISYSKDNPPVHFMSKRARVVAVSRRHAFPPSKLPKGKMDGSSTGVGGATAMLGEHPSAHGSNSWVSSYEIQNEGILPSGWLEKHARALPSALVVVSTLKLTNDDARRLGIKNAVRAVDDLRLTLAEKRSVPIHLVCLMKEEDVSKETKLRNLNAIREKICQECYLPQSQVFLIKCPCDLEPDDFESKILNSPYLLPKQQQQDGSAAGMPGTPTTASATTAAIVMNPLLRQLDRSLRDTSALYYSRLAESQERKLMLWRNRYHNTNASFEVNTLLAAMRCARYAMKVGTLREFQMRTGVGGGAVVGLGNGGNAGGGRWTDRSSSAMRHYDEAYRWVMELHRRAISWRVSAVSSSSSGGGGHAAFPSPVPMTPGGKLYSDGMGSPKFSESPGGGIGVELSLPGSTNIPAPPSFTGATPPPPGPPMRRNSPALTSRKGYDADDNIAFFASLWEQCRAVASIINAKLLRSTTSTANNSQSYLGSVEAQEQWSRHRIIFLATPQDIPNFIPTENDDFFGPAWHRFEYVTEELLTFACIAEGRWRRALMTHSAAKNNTEAAPKTAALTPSYHQRGAPWKAYGELSEALLGLRRVVKRQLEFGYSNEWPRSSLSSGSGSSGRRKFVGAILSGDSGIGTMQWRFENESKRDHRAMALDYVLHALDLLEENISLCNTGSTSESLESASPATSDSHVQQPNSSARLHYLAARLLMSLDNPMGASVHLKIAAAQTKSWPSMHLSMQRALFACEKRSAAVKVQDGPLSSSVSINNDPGAESKDSCIELLLRADSCQLLSPKEMMDAQMQAWKDDPAAVGAEASKREIVWTHDDTTSKTTKPPFEFAVSFLKSTHATSSDTVTACVSIKSCLDFKVCVESMQLLTTSGTYDVSNLERCVADKSLLRSICRIGDVSSSFATNRDVPKNQGVTFDSNDVAFFLTEISLPSNLSDIALGGSSVDTSKFIPKNGRLCNTGLSHAAGNICESRFDNNGAQGKISIDGKPIAIANVPETSFSLLGGIPLACHGVVLTLKRATGDESSSDSSLKLQIERPSFISPLLRSGTQRLVMEECNYTAHAWSRPAYHPWCLGPRVLRVLGPRPQMHVTNLTDSQTDCKAVEGTVNRIMLRLKAGEDEDCHDVRVRLKCESSTTKPQSNESANDAMLEGVQLDGEPHRMPIFVRKAVDPTVMNVTENGVALPEGWEPREDVGTDESHDVTTKISPHLGSGKSLLVPLDVFRPMDQSIVSPERDASNSCSTSYEVIIMYRQVRAGKGGNTLDKSSGDQVMVMQSGSVEWISPFTAEFSQTNGTKKPYPCGIQHASNMATQSPPLEPSSSVSGAELIAADGERVQMRCSFEAKGLGSNIAASILRVTNEIEMNELQKVLYSSDSGLFMNQTKQGSKLSLSYSVSAQRDIESDNGDGTIPLGIISVNWKPVSLHLPDDATLADTRATADEFGSTHGPLSLSNLTPMIFYGPQCQVLNAPFKAKLLKCPSMPKVGTPFCISYQVSNQTAKSQSLRLSLNDAQDGDQTGPSSNPQLLSTGKLKEEMQMAPFEEKTFSFTFISMVAGKILRPPLTVSSGRHETWVINETLMSSRYLFVMP